VLRQGGTVQGMSVYCCGKPLTDSGNAEAFERYADGLLALFEQRGVARLVVACPNCFYWLSALFKARQVEGIALDVLPEVLTTLECDRGRFSVTPSPSVLSAGATDGVTENRPLSHPSVVSVAVHDSCPDRADGRFGRATRALLASEGLAIKEMEHHSASTLCCGAGGLAQVGGSAHSAERCERRLRQFAATGADYLVCSCMSCANAFLSHTSAPKTRHYLELLLDTRIDWRAGQLAYDKMLVQTRELSALALGVGTKIFDADD
jgi:Fe-S oxidoreductase